VGHQAFEAFVERPRHAPDVSDGLAVVGGYFLGPNGAPALDEVGHLPVLLGHFGDHSEVDEPRQVATKALRVLVDLVFGGRVVVQDGCHVIEQQAVDIRGPALHLLQDPSQAGLGEGRYGGSHGMGPTGTEDGGRHRPDSSDTARRSW
jgi:hypothetical protein